MRDASRFVMAVGAVCAVLGAFWNRGMLAVAGVVLLVAGALLRLLQSPPREGPVQRPRFGPTTVASTVGTDAGRPIDIAPPRD
jgi:hypothetical protein